MGIISPKEPLKKTYSGSKKALEEAMSQTASMFVVSPLTGERVTNWQAVVDRQFKIAQFAESDKDATSSAKFIRDTLFGRPAVMKQGKKSEIPAIVFVEKQAELDELMNKAALGEDDSEESLVGITFDDGSELLVETEDGDDE
jgi:hypothetical protein